MALPYDTDKLIAQSKAMVEQTQAEGTKPFAGSSYSRLPSPAVSSSTIPTPTNVPGGAPVNIPNPNYQTPTPTAPPTSAPSVPPAVSSAQSYLDTQKTPQTREEIRAQKQQAAQQRIDAINRSFDQRIGQAQAEARGVSFASGLVGSPEAGRADYRAVEPLAAERDTQVSNVMADIEKDVTEEYRYQQESATKSAEDILTRYQNNQKTATQNLQTLGSAGVDPDKFKEQKPQEYQHLLDMMGGDESLLRANMIMSRPQSSILQSGVTPDGSSYYQVSKDPITGAIKAEHLDLGIKIPQGYDKPTKVGNNLIFTPKNWDGDPSKLITKSFAPSAPSRKEQLQIQGLQLTNQRKQQLNESSLALEASRIVGSQIKSDARVQNFLKISPQMSRLQSATDQISSEGVNAANAAELLDAVTQLNTGGKVITEGQISLIKDSQSYQDQLSKLKQKVTGQGGVVSKDVADQMVKLAKNTFKLYEDQYKKATAQYNNRLKNVGGRDLREYSPLTDITALPDVASGAHEQSLQQEVTKGTADVSTMSDTELQDATSQLSPEQQQELQDAGLL